MEKYGKKEVRFIFGIVQEKIEKHDPVGLLEMGAPKGEYIPEVIEVVESLKRDLTEEQFFLLVDAIFHHYFDGEYDASRLKTFTEEVYRVLKDKKYII